MRKAALVALAAGMLVLVGSSAAAQPRSDVKNYQHVFEIMMENTGYDALVGNPNAPWLNSAIAKYGVATNSYGVAHPSQPNYIAATAGTRAGVPDDNDVTVDLPNIVDQLESHGKTWKGYMQSYSLCNGNPLAHACGNQLYERKHNPFISFADVQNTPARVANIVDFTQFGADLANGTVPDYSWISPDQCNDMHGRAAPGDPCDFSQIQQLIRTGDRFLADTVAAIQASSAWNGNSVIFITWDESDFTGSPTDFGFGDTRGCCTADPGGGHVLTLVISHSDHQPRSSDVAYNHYSILRTIEDGWKLGCLAATCDTADVPAMTDLVGPAG